ncbi:MAG: hypothetical protein H0U49_12955 [Parachlamydiaceae bacterium]|nr:hypothetical protein [Parachlamydiaceae bacterium]
MKNWQKKIFLFACLGLVNVSSLFSTPLDDYVKQFDPYYHWEISSVEENPEAKIFVVSLTSQKWRSSEEVDKPIWKHQLTIVVPTTIKSQTAILSVGSGLQEGNETIYSSDKIPLQELALRTNRVVCEVSLVPNQYLKFSDEWDNRYAEKGRKEDALVAYTWDKYLKTEDPTWPLRMPMTKAVVRAMDACEELLKQKLSLDVDGFILIGASKRGWTAWTSAAVDSRVKGIIPIVIDLLNLKTSFTRHFMAYGNWSFAVRDYADIHIPERWHGDAFARLMKIIEPFEYRERLIMPKYIINATGDEFFLPDSSSLYFHDLPKNKHLVYLPNTGHRVLVNRYLETVIAYVNLLASHVALPTTDWQLTQDNQLKVKPSTSPLRATLWQAHNPNGRDFRVVTIGSTWTDSTLTLEKDGTYSADLVSPKMGWSAYFIELEFSSPNGEVFKTSTDVFIFPDTFPFADKSSSSGVSSVQTLAE